jgi:RND family efflux transporter MFP subunit
VVVLALAGLGWAIANRALEAGAEGGKRDRSRPPAPVAVAPVTTGTVVERLQVPGTLTAIDAVVVASQVAGRLQAVHFAVGDVVTKGAVVAQMEDAPFKQALAAAEAEVLVAQAKVGAARSTLSLTERAAERAKQLIERGVIAESERDQREAELLAARATIAVAEAEVVRAQTRVAEATTALAETKIIATWDGDDEERAVSECWVDAGEAVAKGGPVIAVLQVDPVQAVLQVTESSYGQIALGQTAMLHTDAYPGHGFPATVAKIAPNFNPASRQAQVALLVPNADRRLKPGMFVRAELALDRHDNVRLVPVDALVSRSGEPAVYAVAADGTHATRVPVRLGLRDAGMVEVTGAGLTNRVVTLGHHLIGEDGAIAIAEGGADQGAEVQAKPEQPAAAAPAGSPGG